MPPLVEPPTPNLGQNLVNRPPPCMEAPTPSRKPVLPTFCQSFIHEKCLSFAYEWKMSSQNVIFLHLSASGVCTTSWTSALFKNTNYFSYETKQNISFFPLSCMRKKSLIKFRFTISWRHRIMRTCQGKQMAAGEDHFSELLGQYLGFLGEDGRFHESL